MMRPSAALALLFFVAAPALAQYSDIPRSDDGIGKLYMGREIARITGQPPARMMRLIENDAGYWFYRLLRPKA